MTERWLARADRLENKASEGDWINSRVRILGEGYGVATRAIAAALECGDMVVVAAPPKQPTP